ncbi:unnamed protein product, partial [Scytosiphon promiscuus]
MAVQSEKLDVLKYVVSQGSLCWEDTVGAVGFSGKMEFLEYMKNTPGVFQPGIGVSSGYGILDNAVLYKHYNVLEWCLENGYSLDPILCEQAAQCGDLDMMKWLRSRGCGFGNTLRVCKKR